MTKSCLSMFSLTASLLPHLHPQSHTRIHSLPPFLAMVAWTVGCCLGESRARGRALVPGTSSPAKRRFRYRYSIRPCVFFSFRYPILLLYRTFQTGNYCCNFIFKLSNVADPGSGAYLTPGSGMEKNSDILDFSESLETVFWAKNMRIRIRDPESFYLVPTSQIRYTNLNFPSL
jgi:hypothetical protein